MNEEQTTNMEFDLNEMSKDDLINFIIFAHKHDYTFNQAFVAALEGVVKQYEIEKNAE
jgi:hypothetical protein